MAAGVVAAEAVAAWREVQTAMPKRNRGASTATCHPLQALIPLAVGEVAVAAAAEVAEVGIAAE